MKSPGIKFHAVHGGAIRLEADKTVAIRKKGFCDGITFSNKPVKVGQCYSLKLTYAQQWSGALRLGVTIHDPSSFSPSDSANFGPLPKYACPDLLSLEGFWAKPVREEYVSCESGSKVTFQLTSSGRLLLFVNNKLKGAHLTGLPVNVPLWAIIDVYGTTNSVHILPEGDVPVEVIARGPKFLDAYKRAMANGTAPLRHFRLYLVGKEGVGKTSLARALVGLKFDPDEPPTPGLDCSTTCEADVGSLDAWKQVKILSKVVTETADSEDTESILTDCPETVEEQELLYSIARNIVWEMKYSNKPSNKPSSPSRDIGWSIVSTEDDLATVDNNQNLKHKGKVLLKNESAANSNNKLKGNTFRNFVKRHQSITPIGSGSKTASQDWHLPLAEISQKIVHAIEDLQRDLKEFEENNNKTGVNEKFPTDFGDSERKQIIFDIWDMSGNYIYYPALLSCLVHRAVYLVVFDLASDFDALASCVVGQRRYSREWCDSRTPSNEGADEGRSSNSCSTACGTDWEMTNLDYIKHWLESIFAHATASVVKEEAPADALPASAKSHRERDSMLGPADSLPMIFIVGTHSNALKIIDTETRDKLVKDKFSRIKETISGQPYEMLVNQEFLAIDCDSEDGSSPEDVNIGTLRQKLSEAGWKMQFNSQQVPLTWLQLRATLAASAHDGVSFLSFDQVRQLNEENRGGAFIQPRPVISHMEQDLDLWTALDFLHDVGSITVCHINNSDASGMTSMSPEVSSMSDISNATPLIVLKPGWLVHTLAALLHPELTTALSKAQAWGVNNRSFDEESHVSGNEPEAVWTNEYPNCEYPGLSKMRHNNKSVLTLEESIAKFSQQWTRLERDGVLEQCLYQQLFQGENWVQESILALLAHHDVLAFAGNGFGAGFQHCNQSACRRMFYVPSRIFLAFPPERLLQDGEEDVVFYLHFNNFFSDSLFSRIVSRVIQWSQESGCAAAKKPVLFFRAAVVWLEGGHTLVLVMSALRYSRIKMRLTRQTHLDDFGYDLNASCRSGMSMGLRNSRRPLQRDPCFNGLPKPAPQICAKVRHMLESQLLQIKQSCIRRLSYRFLVKCPCDKACDLHRKRCCADENCLHFLFLDDCLNSSVLPCDYRRIKTEPFRLWFPTSPKRQVSNRHRSGTASSTHQLWMEDGGVGKEAGPRDPSKFWDPPSVDRAVLAIPDHLLPDWVTTVAKMLLGSPEGSDWNALGIQLGYKRGKLEQLEEAVNPALVLLKDWFSVSGNSFFCLETLVGCLEQMNRQDIAAIIKRNSIIGSPISPPPDVFLSYDWESQDDVLLIRTSMEKLGYVCWMDVGQMGGGDSLYTRIYQGISQAKVFLCFVTPRYSVSQWTRREVSLADVMRKPILPVMLTPTPWPPPGPLAVVLSHLVFIDMSGMGGHGGSGRHGDWETRFKEIVFQVSTYTSPKQGALLTPAVRPKSNVQILEVSDFGRGAPKFESTDGIPSLPHLTAGGGGGAAGSLSQGNGGGRDNNGVLRINPNLPPVPQPLYIEERDSSARLSAATTTTRARSSVFSRRFSRVCCWHPHSSVHHHVNNTCCIL
ncbi:unnamed protein product [Notodromas monacha]|uniref:Uncharacterized protein n=1 Tax=Notodromas monacha TaxID=399045 RepID=A0A7R9BSN6_9CRUS|nr:unnamed protein product [Notodromas monacha]CAG0919962.1 unnamed protein product [Notodromas monacha]